MVWFGFTEPRGDSAAFPGYHVREHLTRIIPANLIVLDASDIDQRANCVTSDAHRRSHVRFQHDWNSLDLETVLEREIDELHVERKPLHALKREERFSDITPQTLEATLCVEESAGHERCSDG